MTDLDRQTTRRIRRGFLSLFSASILAACGGGGGGSSSPAPAAPANQPPVASFTLTPSAGAAPLTVTVDGSASADADGDIAEHLWDFGDSSDQNTSVGEISRFTYADPGDYSIRLRVIDDDGAVGTETRTVQVTAAAGTATLIGSIQVLASSAIDADVNDRLTTPTANNDFASAQPLTNPAVAGGFANLPGTGESTGNLFATGDPGDFYQITLAGGENILLSIADSGADLDLRLWDSGQQLVDASAGTGESESLSAPAPGSYFIEVVPFSGGSNYVLSVGQESVPLARSPSRLSDPFIPDEILVRSSDAKLAARYRMTERSRSGRFAMFGLQQPSSSYSSAIAAEGQPDLPIGLPEDGSWSQVQIRKYVTLVMLKQLARDPAVEIAEPNVMRFALQTPDDPFYAYQWHYESVNLPLAWDLTTASGPSDDVVVAVIDTGILSSHPDLIGQLTVDGYDFISDPSRARDGDGIDADPEDAGDLAYGGSSSYHGTHVAGTIAARTDNALGVAGVAWGAQVMPLRVLGVNGGSSYDVAQAIRYAAGLSNDSGRLPSRRADVINLSLGSNFSTQVEQDAITDARAAGSIIVASAGNDASELPIYPAAYMGVIGVSATTITKAIAPYSNFGTSVDIAAPGGNTGTDLNADGIGDGVISTLAENAADGGLEYGYAALSGTSMAAPHVSGVVALMKSAHPALNPAELDLALLAGDLTDDLGTPGRDDQYGYGFLNAQRAVLTALELASGQGSDPGPIVSASASTLNFGAFTSALPLNIQNVGTGTVQVLNIAADQPWLTAIPEVVDGSGLGTYTLTPNRSGLGDGLYSATLAIDTDANDLTVRILMQVSSLNLAADAGLHYVILVDELGNTATPAVLVSADNGRYDFSVADVAAGQYRVFAGTDSDDDGFLCDSGEACGAYPTLDLPERISVNGDRSGLDFVSGFRVNFTTPSAKELHEGDTGIPFSRPASHPASHAKMAESDTPIK